MAARKFLASVVAVLLFCAMFSVAQRARSKRSYAEINKLPAAARQKRLEDGAAQRRRISHYSDLQCRVD